MIQTRWLIRRDIPQILDIEQDGNPPYWDEEDFAHHMRQRNGIGMVAEDSVAREVAGFMLYELHRTSLVPINLCVRLDYRRQGIGRAMIERLQSKCNHQRRQIDIAIRDENLDAQLFLRACGFTAFEYMREFFEDGSDGILFQWFSESAVVA